MPSAPADFDFADVMVRVQRVNEAYENVHAPLWRDWTGKRLDQAFEGPLQRAAAVRTRTRWPLADRTRTPAHYAALLRDRAGTSMSLRARVSIAAFLQKA